MSRRRRSAYLREVPMPHIRDAIARLPGARNLHRALQSVPDRWLGLPPINYSHINGRIIRDCVGREDPTILDIGCNDGSTTLWMLDLFPRPRVYCLEPDPRAVARFRTKVGERPNVTLIELALSDREGTVDFYQSDGRHDNEWLARAMPQGWDLSGSIKPPHRHTAVHPGITFDRRIAVPTSTLDAVCEEYGIGPIDFIWLDVQGAELDVLRGAARTLPRTRFIYSEYSDRELYKGQPSLRDLVGYLSDFELIVRYPGDALFCNKKGQQAC